MTNLNHTKKALISSVLALVLCFSSLLGTTFAWFTDSVTSSGNVIQTGTLDVEMYFADGKLAVPADNSADWVNADGKALYTANQLWEPGYTDAKHIKISNEGTLALKYQLAIVPTGEVSELANVIDVYLYEIANTDANATQVATRNDIDATMYVGTLADVISKGIVQGNLAADSDYTTTIVLKMQENAGNEYKDLSIGGDFTIQLLATQYTAEKDSFDNQYDLAAPWVGIIPESLKDTTLVIEPTLGAQTGTITINSAEDLVYLKKLAAEWVSTYSNGNGTTVTNYRENNGGKGTDYYYHWTWTIELAADLDMSNIPMDSIDISYWDNFEGNGHTISNVVLKDGQDGLFNNGAKAINNLTVKNITVNAPEAQTVGAVSGNGAMTNVHVENATVHGGKYVGGICGKGSSFVNCSIKNAIVTGTDKTVGGLVGYSIGDPGTATVSGNVVENVTVTGAYNVGGLLGQSQNETVENNTVKNVTVKSTLELPADASSNEVRTAEVAARSQFDNTTIGTNTAENVKIIAVANVTDIEQLTTALNDGKTDIALGEGTYKLPAAIKNKTVTISGTKETVIDVASGLTYINGSTVTFDGVTIKSTPGTGYNYGFADAKYTVFNNCTIEGSLGLDYSCEFNNCVFNISGNNYNIWTWGAGTATFNACTFNCDGKAILVYANVLDNGTNHQTVNITDCVFNDNGDDTVTGKAAIEITNTYTPVRTYDVIINNTTVNGFAQTVPGAGDFNAAYGSVAGSNIGTNVWGNKCELPSTQINVVIDGVDVY